MASALSAAADILEPIPNQYPAPVRVEERDGKITLARYKDDKLLATERNFIDWRAPIIDHIREFCSGDFRQGTNHSRVRDRLVTLGDLLSGSVAEVKERQFGVGYEVERLGRLISAYRSATDDMPALNAAVLKDLDQLYLALRIGLDKLERWVEFRHEAISDPEHEGDADPTAVSGALEKMASGMQAEPKYFDPQLPDSFRWLAEAVKDPPGATRAVVYGAVKSAENVIIFLAQKALGIAKSSLQGVEQRLSRTIAATLLLTLGVAVLKLSAALPTGWAWLRPLLQMLASAVGS